VVGEVSEHPVKAYVLAIVKRGTEHEIAKRIRKLEDVAEVLIVYGMWDIVIRIETENLGKIDKIITDIRKLPEIEQTNTLIGA